MNLRHYFLSLVHCVVFGGIPFLVLMSIAAHSIYVLGEVDPKFSPDRQFALVRFINLMVAVEAALGYGICLQIMCRRKICVKQTLVRVILAAGIFLIGFHIWFEGITDLWIGVILTNAPSPISGIWSVIRDAFDFTSAWFVCPALGASSAYVTARVWARGNCQADAR